MKKIETDAFVDWLNYRLISFAHASGPYGIRSLSADLKGNLIVMDNKKQVYKGTSPEAAVLAYNALFEDK